MKVYDVSKIDEPNVIKRFEKKEDAENCLKKLKEQGHAVGITEKNVWYVIERFNKTSKRLLFDGINLPDAVAKEFDMIHYGDVDPRRAKSAKLIRNGSKVFLREEKVYQGREWTSDVEIFGVTEDEFSGEKEIIVPKDLQPTEEHFKRL